MSRQGKFVREQERFRDIVELTFEEAGLPKQFQPDMRLVLLERRRLQKLWDAQQLRMISAVENQA